MFIGVTGVSDTDPVGSERDQESRRAELGTDEKRKREPKMRGMGSNVWVQMHADRGHTGDERMTRDTTCF